MAIIMNANYSPRFPADHGAAHFSGRFSLPPVNPVVRYHPPGAPTPAPIVTSPPVDVSDSTPAPPPSSDTPTGGLGSGRSGKGTQ